MLSQEELESTYKLSAWKNPRLEGVKPISDKQIKSFSDWKRFIVEHELAHADFPRKAGETIAQYENRINQVALRRMTLKGKSPKDLEKNVAKLRKGGISEEMALRIADQAETP